MTNVSSRRIRLSSVPDRDQIDAIGGIVHDPLWFLARQWQVAEFQGENATTPVTARVEIVERRLTHTTADPTVTPAEAIVESERDDWWTMGRRIRVGEAIAAAGELPAAPTPADPPDDADAPVWWFRDPPPPYAGFAGKPDGHALWKGDWGVPDALFAGVPEDIESTWDDRALIYDSTDEFATTGVQLSVRRHRGGRVDWYSVDGDVDPGVALPDPSEQRVLPTRMTFPGMPLTGIWEVEDADADPGAVPPDSSHPSTVIMTELHTGHHDEWFGVPVRASAGHIVRITRLRVSDAFGNEYDSLDEPLDGGLHAPVREDGTPWTLFRSGGTTSDGLDPADLVLWHVAETPLQSDAVERVQLGIDEAANLLWAVERRIDHRDVRTPAPSADATTLIPAPPSTFDVAESYVYVPGEGAQPHWIPYALDETGPRWELVQRRLVDLSVDPPELLPLPRASLIGGGAPAAASSHRIAASAIPSSGLELERRWQLARDTRGTPVLWIQRQRRPLSSPPARMLRFDVAEPTDPPTVP